MKPFNQHNHKGTPPRGHGAPRTAKGPFMIALKEAKRAWEGIQPPSRRARTLAATYFALSPLDPSAADPEDKDSRDGEYKQRAVAAIAVSECESAYCGQWLQWVQGLPSANVRRVTATLQTPLLLNLSGGILENAGSALEFACGVPIIPGSAVKGAARRYAMALLAESAGRERIELLGRIIRVFGSVEADFKKGGDFEKVSSEEAAAAGVKAGNNTGRVCFLQAVPEKTPQLCRDVLTPHHMKYMGGEYKNPEDTEAPVPSFYPAVACGPDSRYTFTLYAATPRDALLDTAAEWLRQAICLFGVGAKGSAGYGFFAVQE